MLGRVLKLFGKRRGGEQPYYDLLDSLFGLRPGNIELYKLALIHRSASVLLPDGTVLNNERLEFLGDAILEAIVSDFLFIEFPDMKEGELTKMRSKVVSRSTLNEVCCKIGLDAHIISNSGNGFVQKHLYGDALEAIIGAMYLDKGYNYTNKKVIDDILRKHLDLSEMIFTETDFKSRLIEWCQKSKHTINFITGPGEGSSAHNPVFRSVAMIDDMELGYGIGSSKKEAEQRAAYSVSTALSDSAGDDYLQQIDNRAGHQKEQDNDRG